MANIFAAITAVLLAASAYLAFKNKQALENEVAAAETATSRLATSQKRLADLRDERDATIDERTGVEEDTIAKQEKEAAQKATNDKLDSDIKSKRVTKEENAEKIADLEDKTKERGDLIGLADDIRKLSTEIAGLEDEKAMKEATVSNLVSNKNSTEDSIKNFRTINEAYAKQQSFFGSARISSIFKPWGFVTISAGNNAGVVTGSTLDVVRDGETVAQLRVRSVEAGRAAADIVPDSIGEDIVLMTGDRVVPSASGAEAGPAEAAAPVADEAPVEAEEAAEEEPEEEEDDFDFDL